MRYTKIVCINNIHHSLNEKIGGLNIGKTYDAIYLDNDGINVYYYNYNVSVNNDDGIWIFYPKEYFVSLSEYRKIKLEKLNECSF
jgi:hypothetical protein